VTKNKIRVMLLVSVLLTSLGIAIRPAAAESTIVKVDPALREYYLNAVGTEFTTSVKIVNATNLYGFDISFKWNTTVLDYVSHSVRVPRNTYPDGVLWNPILELENKLNQTTGTYSIAYTSMSPAAAFNGTGTVFTMTFSVKYHPVQPEPNAVVTLELFSTELAAFGGGSIPHTAENGIVKLYALPPFSTILYVSHAGEKDKRFFRKSQGTVFTVDVGVDNVTDLYAFAINLYYNTTLLDVVSVTEGPFLQSRGSTYVVKDDMNDTEGHVRYALSLLSVSSGANGSGTLFSVTFRATTATLGASNLTLQDTDLGDYNGDPIDHAIMNGSIEVLLVEVIQWTSDGHIFETASSSQITGFAYNDTTKMVNLTLTGPPDIAGYTDLTIPRTAMNLTVNEMFTILFNGTARNHTRTGNGTHYFLYFTYPHSTYEVSILQTLMGDLNGDRMVSMQDIVTTCVAFDSTPSLSHWNPVADLKPNNKIDIYDVILVTRNYDKTWTPP